MVNTEQETGTSTEKKYMGKTISRGKKKAQNY